MPDNDKLEYYDEFRDFTEEEYNQLLNGDWKVVDEPTMNTIAAIAYLEEPEVKDRWVSILNIWSRKDFARWLKIFCIDSGKMSPENAQNCVDWGYVADALFLGYAQDLEAVGDE